MTRFARVCRPLFLLLVSIMPGMVVCKAQGFEIEAAQPDQKFNDCGLLSLFTLIHLEGRETELSEIRSLLPPATSGRGYSMRDLRDAAKRIGVQLTGIRLKKKDEAIDRPMLLFFDRRPHGHYMVIRPIGHSGKLAQLIDPMGSPDVFDKADLFEQPDWTGLALVPDRLNRPARIAGSLLACALVAGLASPVVARFRRRRGRISPTHTVIRTDHPDQPIARLSVLVLDGLKRGETP